MFMPADFGVDFEGPVPNNETGSIEIPLTIIQLDGTNLEQFLNSVDPVSPFEDFGLQHY